MARRPGGLGLLTISAIFVVVLGTMQLGVLYTEGKFPPRDPPSETEQQLRAAVWERVDAVRAERGQSPVDPDTGVQTTARATAVSLTERTYFDPDAPTAVGLQPDQALPESKGLCRRLPAKLTVDDPDWGPDGVPPAVRTAVATRVVALLAENGPPDLLDPADGEQVGLGVAVDGDTVYVVYRACSLGY